MSVDFRITSGLSALDRHDIVVVFAFDDEPLELAGLERVGSRLASEAASAIVNRSLYESTVLLGESGEPTIVVLGAGSRPSFDARSILRLGEALSRFATARELRDLVVVVPSFQDSALVTRALTEGIVRGTHSPGIKKTRDVRASAVRTVTLVVPDATQTDLADAVARGQIVGESANVARELVNRPPNDLTPTSFGERVLDLARGLALRVRVLDENSLRELGMGAILGVAAGSRQPPCLIVVEYGDPDASVRLAVVGKGITFDSGGLSIKTAEGMETMKGDMGGGAAVVGGLLAIARLAPPGIAVTGYIGATENMPGDNAMRPGDVLTSFNGETIEVLNTDAEGRLVLADLLAYAESQGATHIVDIATLTGGAIVALGSAASLGSGRPLEWVQEVCDAGTEGFERIWPMPLYPEYREAMKSDFADIKNSGGRYGAALTATAFLSDFVSRVPWAHLDIAGTSFVSEPRPFTSKGGTGVGVGTLVSLVARLSKVESEEKAGRNA